MDAATAFTVVHSTQHDGALATLREHSESQNTWASQCPE
jgi:hypothetical protein